MSAPRGINVSESALKVWEHFFLKNSKISALKLSEYCHAIAISFTGL